MQDPFPSNTHPDFAAAAARLLALQGIAAYLTGPLAAARSPHAVAESAADVLRRIDEALTPIFGVRGVAALFQRSAHPLRSAWPWLPPVIGPAALLAELAQHAPADAVAAASELLQGFNELLEGLVGASLTERLLRPVWVDFLNGPTEGGAS